MKGIDFIHIKTQNIIQVKSAGWHQQDKRLLAEWLDLSKEYANQRWLVECEPQNGGQPKIYRVNGNQLVPSTLQALIDVTRMM